MIISRKIMMEVLPYLNIPQTEEITDELLQELELTREDVENGRNAALIKEKSETTETDEYGNVISSGTVIISSPILKPPVRKCHLFWYDR